MKVGAVTPDRHVLTVLAVETTARQCTLEVCSTLVEAVRTDAILIFAEWPIDRSALDVLEGLRMAKSRTRAATIVVFLPRGLPDHKRRALEAGADDVILTPLNSEEVGAEIDGVLQGGPVLPAAKRRIYDEILATDLIGADPVFVRLLVDLIKAAASDAHVLLLGETGTGKDVFANAIHRLSSRSEHAFFPVNMSAMNRELIESRLFGHRKGAFTGADSDREGIFAAVGEGTLFLDEIGDFHEKLQARLLRVIESRQFQRLGDNRFLTFRGRLIAATWRDLDVAVRENRFRQDLMRRLDQLRISLPPLRERKSDIPFLANAFLSRHSPREPLEISGSAMNDLQEYDYPGNVRELENAMVHAITSVRPGSLILPRHLPANIRKGTIGPVGHHLLKIPERLAYIDARSAALEMVDAIYLGQYLSEKNENQSAAAEAAAIDRKTFATRWENAQKWIKG